MSRTRFTIAAGFVFVALLIGIYFATDSLRDLNSIRALINQISVYASAHRLLSQIIFFGAYLFISTFAIPVSLYITLLGGALFGVVQGSILSWLACSIGATFSFLIARHILGQYLIEKLKQHLHIAKQTWADDGLFYLFSLRLIPGFPYVLTNFLMALLPVRTLSFFLVTLAGALPLTIVFTNAGFRLGELRSLKGVLQPSLLISLIAIGIAPLLLKKLLSVYKKRTTVTA